MGRLDSGIEDLFRRRHGVFQVMLASVTGGVESARDVVQEAFAQALRDQDGFRGEGSLEGWVWRIAFRVAIGSKGSGELAVEDVPEVAFVDASSDPTLAAAVAPIAAAAAIGGLPALLRRSVLCRDRRGARHRGRDGRRDFVPGTPAAWRRPFGE
jgi:DNA-directed RNA polymerase specialized sigma24 family protein